MPRQHTLSGFTLVELAIVLVIIGLLVGSVLVAKDLIYEADLRRTIGSMQKFRTATSTFRLKYAGIPGDMYNATNYWGTGAACSSNATGGTCNGNGNGRVDQSFPYSGCELTYFWQHLSLAGMIEGRYNPNWPAGVLDKTYLPIMSLRETGIVVAAGSINPLSFYSTFNTAGTYMYMGTAQTAGYNILYIRATMPCLDAYNIDRKVDDGKPGLGQTQITNSSCADDTNRLNGATANYLPNSTATNQVLASRIW